MQKGNRIDYADDNRSHDEQGPNRRVAIPPLPAYSKIASHNVTPRHNVRKY
jgi:hypothetical protein